MGTPAPVPKLNTVVNQIADGVLGSARLEIDGPSVAGAPVSFRITYTAGAAGVDDRGAVRVSWRGQAGLGDPQFEDPTAPGYLSLRTVSEGSVRPQAKFNPRGHRRPFVPAVTVHTDDGGLWPGDRLEFAFGDTSGGSPGIRAPVTVVQAFEFQVSVDCKGAQEFLDLDGFLTFPVVAGPPVRLVAIAPSDAQVGQPFAVRARFEDVWGNPGQCAWGQAAGFDVRPRRRVGGRGGRRAGDSHREPDAGRSRCDPACRDGPDQRP